MIHHKNRSSNKAATSMRSVFRHIGRDPFIDWVITFVVFLCLSATLVFVAVSAYVSVQKIYSDIPPASLSVSGSTINMRTFDRVTEHIDAQNAERSDILRAYSGPSDPAL